MSIHDEVTFHAWVNEVEELVEQEDFEEIFPSYFWRTNVVDAHVIPFTE